MYLHKFCVQSWFTEISVFLMRPDLLNQWSCQCMWIWMYTRAFERIFPISFFFFACWIKTMKKDYAQELNDIRISTYLASHWNLLMACLIVCILKNTIALLNTWKVSMCFLAFYNVVFKNVSLQCCLAFKTHRNLSTECLWCTTHTGSNRSFSCVKWEKQLPRFN